MDDKTKDFLQQRWYNIFNQLSESQRFVDFIKTNYDIQEIIDDDTKTIETRVIEKPFTQRIDLSLEETFKIHGILSSMGVKDPVKCFNKIIAIIENKTTKVLV